MKTVAFTGSYNDLANKPTIPDGSKYLPLTGGVMTGDIDMATNRKDIIVGSNPVSNRREGTAIAGGSFNASTDFTQEVCTRKTFIGSATDKTGTWHNILSVRHRNGANDGVNFGMYLCSLLTSEGNLIWNKQTGANEWQGERTLLDSVNFTDYAADKNHTHPYVPWIAMGGSGARALYGIFASLPDTNPTLNQGATLLVTDAGNFVSGQTGAWLVQISNRNNKPWMTITTLIPHAAGDVQFGYYHDTANKLFYFGVYTTPYRSTLVVSTFRCGAAVIKNFASYESEPSGWTVVNPQYDITEAATLTDSGWIIPTFPSGIKNSTIRYRKQGKIVSVSGYVIFSEATSAKVVLTLPEGYRPPAKIQQFNAADGSAQPSFLTTIDTNGKVSFVGKTQGFFTTANEYYIHCTFFVD